jgi:hypothetical protein
MVMKEFIKKHLLVILFSATGALGGFLYWKFVGCLSGTCVIKSVWYLSTLYGLLFGYLAGGLVKEIKGKFNKTRKI